MSTELVRQIAFNVLSKLPPGTVDIDDLIQVGSIGLIEAESRYDAESNQGVPFEAYAAVRIRGAMLDELRNQDWMSRESRRQLKRIEQHTQRLYHQLGRSPTEGEVAASVELPLNKYRELCLNVKMSLVSLEDLKVNDTDAEDFLDHFFVNSDADPVNILLDKERNNQITLAFKELPQKDRLILQMSYGEGRTLKDIGSYFNVTEARAHQMRKAAVNKIRLTLEAVVL